MEVARPALSGTVLLGTGGIPGRWSLPSQVLCLLGTDGGPWPLIKALCCWTLALYMKVVPALSSAVFVGY